MLYKWIPIQSTKHKWSPKTYTQSVAMVQNLIVPYIGKRKVQELRTYDIEKFYATLSRTPCGLYVKGVKQKLTKEAEEAAAVQHSIHEVHTPAQDWRFLCGGVGLDPQIPIPVMPPRSTSKNAPSGTRKPCWQRCRPSTNPALHLAVHMSMILSLREERSSAYSRVIWTSMQQRWDRHHLGQQDLAASDKALWKRSTPIRSTTPSRTSVRGASPLLS